MYNPSVNAAAKTSGQATCAKQTAGCRRHLTCNNLIEVSRECVRPIHSIIRWREMLNIRINWTFCTSLSTFKSGFDRKDVSAWLSRILFVSKSLTTSSYCHGSSGKTNSFHNTRSIFIFIFITLPCYNSKDSTKPISTWVCIDYLYFLNE